MRVLKMVELDSTFEERLSWSLEKAESVYAAISVIADREFKSIMILEEENDMCYGDIFDIVERENVVWHDIKKDYPHIEEPSLHILYTENLTEQEQEKEDEKRKLSSLHFKAQSIELKIRLYNEALKAKELFLAEK